MAIFKRQPLKTPERKFFTDLLPTIPMPDLVEVQKNSYDWFLKQGVKELFDEDYIGKYFIPNESTINLTIKLKSGFK